MKNLLGYLRAQQSTGFINPARETKVAGETDVDTICKTMQRPRLGEEITMKAGTSYCYTAYSNEMLLIFGEGFTVEASNGTHYFGPVQNAFAFIGLNGLINATKDTNVTFYRATVPVYEDSVIESEGYTVSQKYLVYGVLKDEWEKTLTLESDVSLKSSSVSYEVAVIINPLKSQVTVTPDNGVMAMVDNYTDYYVSNHQFTQETTFEGTTVIAAPWIPTGTKTTLDTDVKSKAVDIPKNFPEKIIKIQKNGIYSYDDEDFDSGSGLSGGEIAAIVIVVIVVVGIIAFCVVWFVVLKKGCCCKGKVKSSSS